MNASFYQLSLSSFREIVHHRRASRKPRFHDTSQQKFNTLILPFFLDATPRPS
jgi:hypothetical protein